MTTRRIVSARELLKALRGLGFAVVGRKGSHIRLKRKDPPPTRVVIVPDHREIAPGTLAAILRQAGLTREDLEAILDG